MDVVGLIILYLTIGSICLYVFHDIMIKPKPTDTLLDIFIKANGMIVCWPVVLYMLIFCDFKIK